MSSSLKLKSNAGGSVSLTVDDTLATDETYDAGGIEHGAGYIKYSDGTLICYGEITGITIATAYGAGGLYNSTPQDITYAIPFISTPTLTGSGDSPNIFAGCFSVDGNGGQLSLYYKDGTLANRTARYEAIGRWK